LVKAHRVDAQLLELFGQRAMALGVEQLVISRQHEEQPDRDAVEGECDVGPSDTIEQDVRHGWYARHAPPGRPFVPLR